jgi:hypothetical protein
MSKKAQKSEDFAHHKNPTTLDSASLRPEFARPLSSGRIFRMPKIENSLGLNYTLDFTPLHPEFSIFVHNMKPSEYMSMVNGNFSEVFGGTPLDIQPGTIKSLPNGLIPREHVQVFVNGVGTYVYGVVARGDLPEIFANLDELTSQPRVAIHAYVAKPCIEIFYKIYLDIQSNDLRYVTGQTGVREDFRGPPLEKAVAEFLRNTMDTIIVSD